jgi:hypothetical protein
MGSESGNHQSSNSKRLTKPAQQRMQRTAKTLAFFGIVLNFGTPLRGSPLASLFSLAVGNPNR